MGFVGDTEPQKASILGVEGIFPKSTWWTFSTALFREKAFLKIQSIKIKPGLSFNVIAGGEVHVKEKGAAFL